MSYRVAIVGGCLSSHGGGVPRSMAQQACALQQVGCKVSLFSGFSKQYPFTPDQLGIENIPSYVSRLWGPSILGLFPGALFQLWKHAESFDLIHLNGAWSLTTFLAGLIAHFKKTPYVISCRSHYGDYHFSRLPKLKKILFHTLEKLNIRNAYALHVTADWEEKTSWKAVRLAQRIIKIPNPVNLTDFTPLPSRAESRKVLNLDPFGFYVIHLGRLGKQKNLPFLMKAFHKANLGGHAHMVFVGLPERLEKETLNALSKELKIEQQITFIDFSKGRERCHWLAASDVFALPSHDENFCVSAIEAYASGTYCILSPHVGAMEYLPESAARILPLEQAPWIETLKKLNQTRPKQTTASPSCLGQFSADHICEQWITEYKKIGSYKHE